MYSQLILQEKHEIWTHFKDKKKLVAIVTKLDIILETKKNWFLNCFYYY